MWHRGAGHRDKIAFKDAPRNYLMLFDAIKRNIIIFSVFFD